MTVPSADTAAGPSGSRAPEKAVPSGRPSARSSQRGDIQGLRALAVLAVVFVHVGVSSVTGGFVGVDVFFAISGFLITQQIVRGIERTGRVSLVDFYARRAKRILPAATLVLIATCAYSALELGFLRTEAIVQDALWSAFFLANIHFAALGTDYFASDLPPSPLQHYWSLSVEEQFYLVWPLVVMVCLTACRLLRYRLPRVAAHPRRWLIISVAAISAASLLYSIHLTGIDPERAYFSPFTRAWELGLGALAALVIREGQAQDTVARWRAQVLSFAGAFLIICAVLQFNDATPFPGTPALVPVLGSVFILVAGTLWEGPTIVKRVLSVRPMRILGDWSYSLYLWHFPVLVLPQIKAGRELTWGERGLLLLLSLVLSGLSYHFVEQPFRRPRMFKRSWVALSAYPASLLLVVAAGFGANSYATSAARDGGYHPAIEVSPSAAPSASASPGPAGTTTGPAASPTPTEPPDQSLPLLHASVQAAREDAPIPSDLDPALEDLSGSTADLGECDYVAGSRKLCPLGDPTAEKTIVLFGNSHAQHWIPAVEEIGRHSGYRVYAFAMPGCIAGLFSDDVLRTNESDKDCSALREWAVQQIRTLKPDLLLISSAPVAGRVQDGDGTWVRDFDAVQDIASDGYAEFVTSVKGSAGRTVWLRDIPTVEGDPGTCLSSNPTLGPCLSQEPQSHADAAQTQVDAARSAGAEALDMSPWFCWEGDCPDVVGSMVVRLDTNHMTDVYSESLARPLGDRLGVW